MVCNMLLLVLPCLHNQQTMLCQTFTNIQVYLTGAGCPGAGQIRPQQDKSAVAVEGSKPKLRFESLNCSPLGLP